MMMSENKKKLNLFFPLCTPPSIQVIASAGHVALYDYDTATEAWRRKDIEGSLFVLRRSSEPRYQMLILNKKSATNYSEDVLGGFEFENAPPYLLYRNERDEVFGVWFYDQSECARLEGILQKIVKENSGEAAGGAAAASAPSSSSSSSRGQAAAAGAGAGGAKGGAAGGDFWDQPASLPAGYDPLGGASRAGQQQQPQQQPQQQQQQQPTSPAPGAPGADHLARLLSSARLAPPPQSPAPVPAPGPPTAGGGSLQALLSRASGGGPPPQQHQHQHQQSPMPPPPPPVPQQLQPPSDVAPAARDAVRRALLALAGDDAFLNAITRALRGGGVPI